MFELAQWLLIMVLGGAVGWLAWDRSRRELPPWLREMDPEDFLTRADFDQYHHRVIQISHVQRDLVQAKIDELTRTIARPAPVDDVPPLSQPSRPADAHPYPQPVVAMEPAAVAAMDPVAPASPTEQDPAARAIALFQSGLSVEQIAQELRIGRQEAQLLIRMARHKNTLAVGV